jgi:hypothetical protein
MVPWELFKAAVPWFLGAEQVVRAAAPRAPGAWRACSHELSRLFPRLESLLKRAHVTDVDVDDKPLVLFSWPAGKELAGWLCEAPSDSPSAELCSAHQVLLRSFGGVIERCGEPPSWLLNHNSVLTAKEASFDASFLSDYAWAFPNEQVPLAVKDFYSVAREANGNTTLCHRRTSEIILFAPDHSFDHVQPWHGLPDYTLYSLDGAPDFPSFVETIAEQWLTVLA